nr:MAG TPA: hypothetical protein [Caudoviricetes sp.]
MCNFCSRKRFLPFHRGIKIFVFGILNPLGE